MNSDLAQGFSPPVRDKVALVVVTYRPGENFTENMEAAGKQFARIFIVDNTGVGSDVLQGLRSPTFDLTCNALNIGLGEALNVGCRRALEAGHEWAVTLDQDTELLPGFLDGMIEAWKTASMPLPLLGSNYYNVARAGSRFPPSSAPTVAEQKTVITSGSLTHLPTWKALGMFRGDYFIDAIDHEFCLRLRAAGLRVAVNRQLGMRQHIGEDAGYAGWVSRFLPYRHSELRKYTSARNATRTLLDYAIKEPLWAAKKALGLVAELLGILFVEPNKRSRLKAFSTGVLHGIQGRLGSVPEQLERH